MASAGRILIIPKGDYNAAAAYENLDLVFYNGDSWLCKSACTGIEPSDANSAYWHRFTEVNVADKTVAFTPVTERTNLANGDKVSTAFGKIAKWFDSLKSAAFAEIANNLTTTTAGKALDALQGLVLARRIGDLTLLPTTDQSSLVAAITEQNSNFAIQIYRATDFVASGNKVDLNAARSGNIVNLVISIPGSVLTASQETLVATMTKLKPRVVQAGIGYHSSGMTLCKYHITKDGEVYITPESGTAYYTVSLSYISEDY